ncbi:tannase and feruloyl esterase-domain-containing protein [Parachaetomium inaequale]|uniref:Carboxylic ester hydrolase n=1 Tax=Parachaetomium inaequale TaxID=2588326 RepID=A0AAN6SQ31_9PEZI|nr:tannase and feruloyl esterase-domain-containing protein [Parachaetomium inaequale]
MAHGICRSDNTTASFEERCRRLPASLNIPNTNSTMAEFVAAGTMLDFPNTDPSCGRASQSITVDLCRVIAQVATSARSGIKMEAWLPAEWSGRFLSTGNGGLGGCIQYEDVHYGASLGFATVGTNNGHDGATGQALLYNPDVIEDFAYRALYTGVVIGIDIPSKPWRLPKVQEAQSFAEGFDGIVAGAPAFFFNNLTSWSSYFYPLTGRDTFVPFEVWPAITQDILRQCDHLDGAVDGLLESHDMCDYDPSGLVCLEGQNSSSCLTATQAGTVRSIYCARAQAGEMVMRMYYDVLDDGGWRWA